MTLCADVYNFVHFSGKNLKYMCNAEALCAHWCVCTIHGHVLSLSLLSLRM